MTSSPYPVTATLKVAIEKLFDNPLQAYRALGVEKPLSSDWYDKGELPASFHERAAIYRAKLEEYLLQIAEESAEYENPEETRRLRAEAIGILVAMRGLVTYLPESLANAK